MLIVFIGPSAIGKTFAADELIKRHPKAFRQPKLYTTRQKRINENMTDRLFVSEEKFAAKVKSNEFAVHGEFAGNRYGFTKNALLAKDKHVLINAWPALTPQFAEFNNCLLIGMKPRKNYKKMLYNRMKRRGDSAETINRRIVFIEKDTKDLKSFAKLISNNGKTFTVHDDTSVFSEVLPWIENKLFDS